MKKAPTAFNHFLLVLATGLLAGGCVTTPDYPAAEQRAATVKEKKKPEKKPDKKEATIIRIYLEKNQVEEGRTQTVSVYRDNPITVNFDLSPVLYEAHIAGAVVVPTEEGAAIRIQLTPEGAHLLDSLSVFERGKRLGVAARWTEGRWLGAPRLVRRISDGSIVFIPDAAPVELEHIVNGINNLAAKNKGWTGYTGK